MKSQLQLSVRTPRNYSPKKYAQHAVSLTIAAIIYCLLSRLITDLPEVFQHFLDSPYFLVAACVVALLLIWKARAIIRYIRWRATPPVQLETLQSLLYLGFVSTGYYWFEGISPTSQHINILYALILPLSILGVTLAYTLLAYWLYITERSRRSFQERLNIINDTPHEDEPLPSQSQVLAALITILDGTADQDDDGALAIALDGAWGDGKSSITKMALKYMTASYVVVQFEPWRYTTQEALVAGFYTEIGKQIEIQLPGFQITRFDMLKFARGFITSVDTTGIVKPLLNSYSKRSVDYPEKINNHLKRHDKKLLVIIDDVDRLHDDSHVMRTLQLAQYLKGDIERSVILFIAEMDRIKEAIPKRLRHAYLQKFFDITLMVTKPTREELIAFINTQLKDLELKADVHLETDTGLLSLLRNLRGAKRVLSMLAADIDNMGDVVNAQDIFFMRVMYYTYPVLYADIRDDSSMYFEYDHSFESRDFGVYGFDEDVFEADQIKHFETLFENMDLKLIDTKRLKTLLENYFPYLKNVFRDPGLGKMGIEGRKLFRNRRIGNREHLDRYFVLNDSFDQQHESEDDIKSFIESDYMKGSDEKRTETLLEFYHKSGKDNPKLFFTSLLGAADDISKELEEAEVSSLYRDILRTYFRETGYIVRDNDGLLTRIIGAIDRNVQAGDYDKVFNGIEEFIAHPSTGLRLTLYINPDRGSFHNLGSYRNYKDLRARILTKVDKYYFEENRDIFKEDQTDQKEWRFILYQWATSVSYERSAELAVDRRTKVNDYVIRLLSSDVLKLHEFIMSAFWQHDLNANKYRFIFNTQPSGYEEDRYVAIVREQLAQSDDLSLEIKDDFEKFIAQYETHKQRMRAADAPSITAAEPLLQWATNFHGAGASFNSAVKVDNFGGTEDYITGIRLIGKLQNSNTWMASDFIFQQQGKNEPRLVQANKIETFRFFISDDFTRGRTMPDINSHDATLELIFRSNKKRVITYKAEDITQ